MKKLYIIDKKINDTEYELHTATYSLKNHNFFKEQLQKSNCKFKVNIVEIEDVIYSPYKVKVTLDSNNSISQLSIAINIGKCTSELVEDYTKVYIKRKSNDITVYLYATDDETAILKVLNVVNKIKSKDKSNGTLQKCD